MRKSVQLNGISTVTDYQDGDFISLYNMRKKNGVMRPVAPRDIIYQNMPYDYSLMYMHRNENYENLIGVEEDGTQSNIHLDNQLGATTLIGSVEGKVIDVAQLGNILIITTENNVYYSLFKNNEYTWLGEFPQLPAVQFVTTLDKDCEIYMKKHPLNDELTVSYDEHIDSTKPLYAPFVFSLQKQLSVIRFDSNDDLIDNTLVEEKIEEKIQGFINDVTDGYSKLLDKFCLYDAHFFRYSFTLYDDTHIHLSPPILVCPHYPFLANLKKAYADVDEYDIDITDVEAMAAIALDEVPKMAFHIDIDTNLKGNDNQGQSFLANLCTYKILPQINQSKFESLKLWKDIIKSIDIFMSPALGVINVENMTNLMDGFNYENNFNHGGAHVLRHWEFSPLKTLSTETINRIEENSLFYKIKSYKTDESFPIDEFLLDDKSLIKNNDMLVQQEQLIETMSNYNSLIGKSFLYNNKIHKYNYKINYKNYFDYLYYNVFHHTIDVTESYNTESTNLTSLCNLDLIYAFFYSAINQGKDESTWAKKLGHNIDNTGNHIAVADISKAVNLFLQTQNFSKILIEVELTIENNDYTILIHNTDDEVINSIFFVQKSPVISFPDRNARKITFYAKRDSSDGTNIDYLANYYKIKEYVLTPHKFLNTAYNFNQNMCWDYFRIPPDPTNIPESADGYETLAEYGAILTDNDRSLPDGESALVLYRKNILCVSRTNNPFLFADVNTYQFDSNIFWVSDYGMNVSDRNFGLFPLYVATARGISVMETGSGEIYYTSKKPLSSYVMPNDDSFCSTPYGIVFFTKEKVHLLNSQGVVSLSGSLDNPFFDDPHTYLLPHGDYDFSCNNHYINHSLYSDISFRDFISDVKNIFYNPHENELIIQSNKVEFMFVYCFDSKIWYKSDEVVELVVQNALPRLLVKDGINLKDYFLSKKDDYGHPNAWVSFVTRPMRLGSIDVKKLQRIILRGKFFHLRKIKITYSNGFYSELQPTITIYGCNDDRVFTNVRTLKLNNLETADSISKHYRDFDLGLLARATKRSFGLIAAIKMSENSELDFIDIEIADNYKNDKMR